MLYITLEQAKTHIKEAENEAINDEVIRMIEEAQDIAEGYLPASLDQINTVLGYIPPKIKGAILRILANCWTFRGDNTIEVKLPDIAVNSLTNWGIQNYHLFNNL